eukprot:365004-Chlamydomonas_euryale.AAC.14
MVGSKNGGSFRSSTVADAHTTAVDVSQCLTTSRSRRIRDASLATACAAFAQDQRSQILNSRRGRCIPLP